MFDLRIDNGPINHNLKILPQYFDAQILGNKTFEIRKNDRDFRFGDTILLTEIDIHEPSLEYKPTGRNLLLRINYILSSTHYEPFEGLEEGYCIMSTEIQKYRNTECAHSA